jgi:hypothetical protein
MFLQVSQAYFGVKGFDKITIHVLLKSLKCKRKPRRCIHPSHSATYPVYVGHAADKYVVPFENHDQSYWSFLVLKVYLNALKLVEEQVVF